MSTNYMPNAPNGSYEQQLPCVWLFCIERVCNCSYRYHFNGLSVYAKLQSSKNGLHTYLFVFKEPEMLDAGSWLVGEVHGMSWLVSCNLTCCRSVGPAQSFLVVGRSAAQLSSCQAASGCQAASHVLQNHVNLSLSFPHTRATISTELNVHINVTDWLSTLIKLLQSPVRLLI